MPDLVRRRLFQGLGTGCVGLLLAPGRIFATSNQNSTQHYLICARDTQGYAAYIVNQTGTHIHHRIPLPARGHGQAITPPTAQHQHHAVCARRPGHYLLVDGTRHITAAHGHVFTGHAAFSPSGRYLYASEMVAETSAGRIGVYDQNAHWARTAEFSTYGTEPHELIIDPQTGHLIVANGGRLTHPDFPRHPLNPGALEASLTVIDRHTGALLMQTGRAAFSGLLSVRHLTQWGTRVWWAGQLEPGAPHDMPLIGTFDPKTGQVQHLTHTGAMGRYIGSICAIGHGESSAQNATGGIAVSNPRANMAALLNPETGTIRHTWTIPDVCAIAAGAAGSHQHPLTILADGLGGFGPATARTRHPDIKWDNHMMPLQALLT